MSKSHEIKIIVEGFFSRLEKTNYFLWRERERERVKVVVALLIHILYLMLNLISSTAIAIVMPPQRPSPP